MLLEELIGFVKAPTILDHNWLHLLLSASLPLRQPLFHIIHVATLHFFFVFLRLFELFLDFKFLLASFLLFLFTQLCDFWCHLVPLLKFARSALDFEGKYYTSIEQLRKHLCKVVIELTLLIARLVRPVRWHTCESALLLLDLHELVGLGADLLRDHALIEGVV